VTICSKKNGDIVSEGVDVVSGWREYSQEMLGADMNGTQSHLNGINSITESEDVCLRTSEEVNLAVRNQNFNRSPGMDGILAALYKHGGNKL
jgi:hypothetical protein